MMSHLRTATAALLLLVTGPALSAGGLGADVKFSLTNHHGSLIDRSSFEGQHTLVYFGYTHCPDICPLGLSTIATALNQLGEQTDRVKPLFVTIDPERDTVARLNEYVPAFHTKLIGVTGDLPQIRILAKSLGTRFVIAKLKDRVIVDHTDATYLLDPAGKLVAQFDRHATPVEIATQVNAALGG